MRPAHQIPLCAVVGIGFAVTYALRGFLLAGLAGGVLAAVLLFLVLGRFDRQVEERRRDRR